VPSWDWPSYLLWRTREIGTIETGSKARPEGVEPLIKTLTARGSIVFYPGLGGERGDGQVEPGPPTEGRRKTSIQGEVKNRGPAQFRSSNDPTWR